MCQRRRPACEPTAAPVSEAASFIAIYRGPRRPGGGDEPACPRGEGLFYGVVSWFRSGRTVECSTQVTACEQGGLTNFLKRAFGLLQSTCVPDPAAEAKAEDPT